MTPERLEKLIDLFKNVRIGVIGDFFLDKYIEFDPALDEPSLETGKPAHQVVGVRTSPGAAGNVAVNLSALGVKRLHAIGVIGDDGEGYDLSARLTETGCSTEYLFRVPDRATPTYMKPRDIATHGLAGERERYDIMNRTVTPAHLERKLLEVVEMLLPELDALVIVDQIVEKNCGVVTTTVREALAVLAERFSDVVFFADSRSRILSYRNIVTKPNQFEISGVDNPFPGETVPEHIVVDAVKRVRSVTNAPVFVTRGGEGIMVSDPEPFTVRGVTVAGPVDPTGAGDAASSVIVAALASGATYKEAAIVGNLAASVTVEKLGECGTCNPAELLGRLGTWLTQGE